MQTDDTRDDICIDAQFSLKVALSERCKDHKNANGSQGLPLHHHRAIKARVMCLCETVGSSKCAEALAAHTHLVFQFYLRHNEHHKQLC